MLTEPLQVGSLFSGYGGLELGILQVLRGEVAFHVEVEPAPSRILAQHWPSVPNLGDITKVDWSRAPRVHVLCGGFPCQDVSPAGLRKGLRPGTRTGLWSEFVLAIAALRPSLVIVENVRGLLSAAAHSELEPDAWDLGDGLDGPALRAVGAVLGDLADLGYDARWCCVPASAAGAPHQRERVFIVAYPQRDELARERLAGGWIPTAAGSGEDAPADSAHVLVDWAGRTRHWRPELADGGFAAADAAHDDGGRGAGARAEVGRAWGEYGPAIARWEAVLDREAPNATEDGRLSPRFVEWMMGLPGGHVTDVGLTRSQQLKALGNGVVPQQAALAIRSLLAAI